MFISFLFHNIESSSTGQHTAVTDAFFREIISKIKGSFHVRPIDDILLTESSVHEKKISLTFDDGWASDYRIAFPILMASNIAANFFITTSFIDKENYLTKKWIVEMSNAGMIIGSHTVTHPTLTGMADNMITEELHASKACLESITGKEVSGLSIPHGEYNGRILRLAKDVGYKYVATSRPGMNTRESFLIERISVHNKTRQKSIEAYLGFSDYRMMLSLAGYYVRTAFKTVIGKRNYLTIRDRILR